MLEYPLANQVEYTGMNQRSEDGTPWTVPEGWDEMGVRLDVLYACYSAKFIEAKEETWDLTAPSERADAAAALFGENFVGCTPILIVESDKDKRGKTELGHAVPYLLPSRLRERQSCTLPPSGIVTAEVRKLKRMVDAKEKVHAQHLQALTADLSKVAAPAQPLFAQRGQADALLACLVTARTKRA